MKELYFENTHIDYIGNGENKFRIYVAFKDDPQLKVIGYLDYSTVDNDLYVDMIEVVDKYRGQGIGKELYRRLFDINSDMNFMKAGYYTEAGSHIRKWFESEILNNHNLEMV